MKDTRQNQNWISRGALVLAAVLMLAVITAQSAPAQTFTVLDDFNSTDGGDASATLVQATNGNLYGTTQFDNQTNCGCGLVYELSPASGGLWNQTVLHIFVGGSAGQFPAAGLTADGAGNFYGTTEGGGNVTGSGTIFVVTP